MEQVVFIGAHPDDFTGCCGTALLMRKKFGLNIWDFTKGERGLSDQGISFQKCGEMREAEERKVAAYLGAQVYFCGEINGFAYVTEKTCTAMAEKLRILRPRAIFTHAFADRHVDHMMTAAAVFKAIQIAEIKMPEIYTFEFSHQSLGFMPKYFADITEVIEEKNKIIRMYECQNINDSIVKNKMEIAAFRGKQIGVPYAEAFGMYEFQINGKNSIFSEF